MSNQKEIRPLNNTSMYKIIDLDQAFLASIRSICTSITDAGYDPFTQLTGYLTTGDDCYITRKGNARSIITTLEKEKIQAYLKYYL